jgi:hypothetical protein
MTSIKKTGDELATLLRGVAGGEALLAELKDAAPPLLRALQVVIRELRNGGKSKDTSMENVCVKQESTNFGDAATVVPAVSFSSPRYQPSEPPPCNPVAHIGFRRHRRLSESGTNNLTMKPAASRRSTSRLYRPSDVQSSWSPAVDERGGSCTRKRQ